MTQYMPWIEPVRPFSLVLQVCTRRDSTASFRQDIQGRTLHQLSIQASTRSLSPAYTHRERTVSFRHRIGCRTRHQRLIPGSSSDQGVQACTRRGSTVSFRQDIQCHTRHQRRIPGSTRSLSLACMCRQSTFSHLEDTPCHMQHHPHILVSNNQSKANKYIMQLNHTLMKIMITNYLPR